MGVGRGRAQLRPKTAVGIEEAEGRRWKRKGATRPGSGREPFQPLGSRHH